jgi:FkbM family methyltransferase
LSSFVTYAQNFEDVMLWRALHSVTDGFYVDVGAADPDEDSVTRAFYDRGWRGINVEPLPSFFAALQAARPRDVNLQCLVGATQSETELHGFSETGLSTTNATLAARYVADGRERVILRLPVLSLAEIWRRHAPKIVHFLKIDAEGAETDVLRGADFHLFRPWIVLAEATEPGTAIENWFQWESILTDADYRLVWFDGLNRFYLAAEHWEALHGAFATPPNVFDLWIQPRGKQQRALIERGEAATLSALQSASVAHEALLAAQTRIDALREELLVQRRILADLRSRIIVAEAERLAARAEIGRLKAGTLANEARWHTDVARLQHDLSEAQRAWDQNETALRAVHNSAFWRATEPMRGIAAFARNLKSHLRGRQQTLGAIAPNSPEELPAPIVAEQGVGIEVVESASPEADVPASADERRMQARLRA